MIIETPQPPLKKYKISKVEWEARENPDPRALIEFKRNGKTYWKLMTEDEMCKL